MAGPMIVQFTLMKLLLILRFLIFQNPIGHLETFVPDPFNENIGLQYLIGVKTIWSHAKPKVLNLKKHPLVLEISDSNKLQKQHFSSNLKNYIVTQDAVGNVEKF